MLFDINGYIIYGGANVNDYGADAAGADNYSAFTDAIASDYRNIIIPVEATPFLLTRPVYITEGKTVVLLGDVKVADGNIRPLITDLEPDDITIEVTDAELYFFEGQQISVSDDNSPLQGGNAGHTRRESDSFVVVSVSGTTITVDSIPERLAATRPTEAYEVTANAKVGHTQSAFVARGVDNFKFTGTGCIDANWQGQYDVEPVSIGEDTDHGCCISISGANDIEIEGIELKNALLHNITLKSVYGGNITDVNSHLAHDKSILFIGGSKINTGYTEDIVCTRVKCDDSVFEDGFSFYSRVRGVTLTDCQANNCGRHGILSNQTASNITVHNLISNDCGSFSLIGNNSTLFTGTANFSADGKYKNTTVKRHVLSMQSNCGELKNISLSGGNSGAGVIGMTNIVDGILENVIIRDTITSLNEGYGISATSVTPTTLTLRNVVFDNLKQNYNIDANITIVTE